MCPFNISSTIIPMKIPTCWREIHMKVASFFIYLYLSLGVMPPPTTTQYHRFSHSPILDGFSNGVMDVSLWITYTSFVHTPNMGQPYKKKSQRWRRHWDINIALHLLWLLLLFSTLGNVRLSTPCQPNHRFTISNSLNGTLYYMVVSHM